MSFIEVAGERHGFERARLVAYHCDGPEADWNLELIRGGRTLWLAGTVAPGPRVVDDLGGAGARLDVRSIGEVVEALCGRHVFPDIHDDDHTPDFRFVRTPGGVRMSFRCAAEWSEHHEEPPPPGLAALVFEIEAEVAELHPGMLP